MKVVLDSIALAKKKKTYNVNSSGIPMWSFLIFYLFTVTGIAIYSQYKLHNVLLHPIHVALSFFLALNLIVCFFEMVLFYKHDRIAKKCREYQKILTTRIEDGFAPPSRLSFGLNFFTGLKVNFQNVFSSELWTEVWAYYSVFDRSYGNTESFGYFIDVGNGFSTIVPTVIFLFGMTCHGVGFEEWLLETFGGSDGSLMAYYILSFVSIIGEARTLGIIGFASFWQEFYGTIVYFLSFIHNKRHLKLTSKENGFFVCLTNGLWIVFPLVGMFASWKLIKEGNHDVFVL